MPSTPSVSRQVAAARPRMAAKARAGDSAIETALEQVRSTSDVRQAESLVAQMETALAAAKARKDPKAAAYADMVREAKDRVVALKLLIGLPDVPRTEVVRNPANSSERSTLAQSARSRAYLAGYKPAGMGERFLPMFFKREATPAFDKLDAATKAKYLAVAEEADAAGHLALRELLVSGRLSAPLLDGLKKLATMNTDPAIDRRLLLSQALVELQDPVTITQASRGTCAATSIQIMIALTRPAQYVELLFGLASPGGRAPLPGGAAIAREPDWAYANDGGRSIPSRLMQPAFMELGNGDLDYINETDSDRDPRTNRTQVSGLETAQAEQVLDQLGAKPKGGLVSPTYKPSLPADTARALDNNISGPRDWLMLVQNPDVIDPASQQAIVDELKRHATRQHPIYATIVYAPDANLSRTVFHAVLVTEAKDGKVRFVNPWGQEETLSEAAFKRCVVNLLGD